MEVQVLCWTIKIEDRVNLLRIDINDLKACNKLHALARITKYIDINNWRKLTSAFAFSKLF